MRTIDTIYIDGAFVTPHGTELFDLHNPTTGAVIGRVRLGDEQDAQRAIAAAKRAHISYRRTGKAERIALLHRLHDAVAAHADALVDTIVEEYGAPAPRAAATPRYAAAVFLDAARALEEYDFHRAIGTADIVMQPLGVAGLISPWNANAGFICAKLASALAAGCTAVIKPSEMSALQTQAVLQALHEADLPPGLFNVVNGRGPVVGREITMSNDVAKISFTGSTAVGKEIVKVGADSMKRVTLELGGKSPSIILDDADFEKIMPALLDVGFMNSGQACMAGTRILVHEKQLDAFAPVLRAAVEATQVGDPRDPATKVGPMVSQKQWDTVQRYIQAGLDEGATLLAGGPGKPKGLESGFFVKPTVFTGVDNHMTIAREEIFGPVLSVITYKDEDDAIAIANDTTYGLQAYIFSSDIARAQRLSHDVEAGRVFINGNYFEPMAPFGGFKQSGIGREFGVYGLEAFLEPKTLMGCR
ncbi:aldehyde dehydrogenase family protein [Sphingobium sp.]|uniref:aldehyde dehydrogenase family protein n=1 Tax=Sphingobium sp. TaxID=1912891 RepID=UPI003B3B7080